MSQAKVDRYKEEKKNRKKIMAKEKRIRIAGYVAGCLVAVGIIGQSEEKRYIFSRKYHFMESQIILKYKWKG